ncbi:hypothetical protein D3C84_1110250 [compost metagenome]
MPSSLPKLLSRLRAISSKAWALEISPLWLSTLSRFFRVRREALIRPLWLFR